MYIKMEKSEKDLAKPVNDENCDESSSTNPSTDHNYWSIEYFQLNDQLSFITKEITDDFDFDTRLYVVDSSENVKREGNHQSKGIIEKRNARERRRVKAVNEAFAKLRQMVPSVACRGKRVSKVKTLKKAVEYIMELKRALENDENQSRNNGVP